MTNKQNKKSVDPQCIYLLYGFVGFPSRNTYIVMKTENIKFWHLNIDVDEWYWLYIQSDGLWGKKMKSFFSIIQDQLREMRSQDTHWTHSGLIIKMFARPMRYWIGSNTHTHTPVVGTIIYFNRKNFVDNFIKKNIQNKFSFLEIDLNIIIIVNYQYSFIRNRKISYKNLQKNIGPSDTDSKNLIQWGCLGFFVFHSSLVCHFWLFVCIEKKCNTCVCVCMFDDLSGHTLYTF